MDKYIIPTDKKTKVRMPVHPFYFLPEKGAWQNWNGSEGRFWRRRVRDGSVLALDKEPEEKKVIIEDNVSTETTITKRKRK